jgi:V/A-type H+/Na+-transporting ATPase subunit I
MFSTERMKKLELLVLKRDVDDVLRYLGFAGCVQLIADAQEQRELTAEEREIADLKGRIDALARFLGIGTAARPAAEQPAADPGAPGKPGAPAPSREALRDRAAALLDEVKDLVGTEGELLQQRLSLKQTVDELSAFAHLKVAFTELEHLTYLSFRLGTIAPARMEELRALLEKRALIVALGRPGFLMAIAPKKGRWALDTELKKFAFQDASFPSDLKGIPAEVLPSVQARLAEVDGALAGIEAEKMRFRGLREAEVRALLYELDLDVSIDAVKQGLAATGSVQRVSGWIPRRRFKEVVAGLEEITRGRVAIRSYEPEELPDVRSGKTKVPVSVSHGRIVRSFERMVFSYSVPLYGTIDPTPFVAVMFVVLFAIMFGDVGQGLVGLVLGLLINSGRVKSFDTYRRKNFGTVFVVVGIACMVSGFLYGSVFANEKLLVPVVRWVTGGLTGRPVDRIIELGGFQKITLFFGVTLGIGAVVNSVGLVINMINNVRIRNWERALLSKTGFAGAFFFWYVLSIAVRLVFGGRLHAVDVVLAALPLLVLFFREPIARLATGERPVLKDGIFGFVMEGIVELMESAIYYVSNSVSFLRVAAFALAHTVLSSIVFLLADMVGDAPGGIVGRIAIIVIGNAIIILLEGLIVTIQVVRLEYYEFFSKFFVESGEEFKPFKLHSGGQR